MSTRLGRNFEPSDHVLNHIAEEKTSERLASCFVRRFESELLVAEDCRLPEELDEAREVDPFVPEWLQ